MVTIRSCRPVFFMGDLVGQTESTAAGVHFTAFLKHYPDLAEIHDRGFPEEAAVASAVEEAFTAETKQAMAEHRVQMEAAGKARDALAAADQRRETWTGRNFDPNRDQKATVRVIKDALSAAVARGDLPLPADYRVTASKDRYACDFNVNVFTDHVFTPDSEETTKKIEEIADSYNDSMGTGKDPTLDGPSCHRRFQVRVKAYACKSEAEAYARMRKKGFSHHQADFGRPAA